MVSIYFSSIYYINRTGELKPEYKLQGVVEYEEIRKKESRKEDGKEVS